MARVYISRAEVALFNAHLGSRCDSEVFKILTLDSDYVNGKPDQTYISSQSSPYTL
jgi:hypothetical protein